MLQFENDSCSNSHLLLQLQLQLRMADPSVLQMCRHLDTDNSILTTGVLHPSSTTPPCHAEYTPLHNGHHQSISADEYLRQLLQCDSTDHIQYFNNNNNDNDNFITSATATPQSEISSPRMLYTITPQQESPILSKLPPIPLKRESKRIGSKQQQPTSSSSTSTSTLLGSIPNPLRQREFQCTHCPATFWRKQDAQRHEVTHGYTRAFACPNLCGKKFARRDALGRHLKSSKCNSESV